MKAKILSAFISLGCLIQPLFAQDAATNAAPVIPEAARKHFVMGAALFKDAKTAEDYAQVTGEFQQATELAPQWPEARYNLALSKEAAGDYSGAMGDLKLYQAFKLSESEARTVQDKIYVVEAKLAKAKTPAAIWEKMAEDDGIPEAQAHYPELIQKLEGAVFVNISNTEDNDKIHFSRTPETYGLGKWPAKTPYLMCQHDRLYPIFVKPTSNNVFEQNDIQYGKFTLSKDGQTLTETDFGKFRATYQKQ